MHPCFFFSEYCVVEREQQTAQYILEGAAKRVSPSTLEKMSILIFANPFFFTVSAVQRRRARVLGSVSLSDRRTFRMSDDLR